MGGVHDHFAIYADVTLSHHDVKQWWSTAARGLPTTVYCEPPQKSICAAARYMTKDIDEYRQDRTVHKLFEKQMIPITWGSRGFFWKMGAGKTERLLWCCDYFSSALRYQGQIP